MVKYYKNIIVSKFNTMTKIEPDDFAGYLAAAESEDAAKNMDAVDRYILLFMLLFLQENIKCVTSFEKWFPENMPPADRPASAHPQLQSTVFCSRPFSFLPSLHISHAARQR